MGLSISEIEPTVRIGRIEAIVNQYGIPETALRRADPELLPPIQFADNPSALCAESALPVHECDRPIILELRHRRIVSIGVDFSLFQFDQLCLG